MLRWPIFPHATACVLTSTDRARSFVTITKSNFFLQRQIWLGSSSDKVYVVWTTEKHSLLIFTSIQICSFWWCDFKPLLNCVRCLADKRQYVNNMCQFSCLTMGSFMGDLLWSNWHLFDLLWSIDIGQFDHKRYYGETTYRLSKCVTIGWRVWAVAMLRRMVKILKYE